MRVIGTKALGLRTPIIRESDDLVNVVCQTVKDAIEHEKITINDGDIIGITEAVVARSQGNYATIDQIAADVKAKFGMPDLEQGRWLDVGHIGIVFPILSRNRFAMLLKGIARGAEKVTVQLSYPADEVGNQLITWDDVDDNNLNPYSDCLSEADFRRLFGNELNIGILVSIIFLIINRLVQISILFFALIQNVFWNIPIKLLPPTFTQEEEQNVR